MLMGFVLCCLFVLLVGVLARLLVSLSISDHNWTRLCWLLVSPVLVFWLLPLIELVLRTPLMLLQAVFKDNKNSSTWSGTQSSHRLAIEGGFKLPKITILMPVYKESVQVVIAPTVRSLLTAIHHYQSLGGKVNIVIGDDGLQLLSRQERDERISFYTRMGIGWVARPRHYLELDNTVYMRKGKFKLASNVNNVCHVALETETHMNEQRTADISSLPSTTNRYCSGQHLTNLVQAVHKARGDVNWAGGNIQLGEILFMIHSDDRFPQDFLLPMAVEFFLNPQLGILHYLTESMFVIGNTVEQWCAWTQRQRGLNRRCYAISGASVYYYALSAFRRTALKSVSYCDEDGRRKFWSENHVSEDFDLSLRFLAAGHQVRLAGHRTSPDNLQFMEGVSLTIHNEIARYEKMAYSKSEILFNPLRYWITRGPFTLLFRYHFLHSSVSVAQKLKDLCDIALEFTIASSFPILLFNYFYLGFMDRQNAWTYYSYWRAFVFAFTALVVFVYMLYLFVCQKLISHRLW